MNAMIPYAAQSSGPNRRLLAEAGWRAFVSPDTFAKNGDPVTRYALDNGAWGAHLHEVPWDAAVFEQLVDRLGASSDFVVIPDVVADRSRTLAMATTWIPRLAGLPLYLAVQDEMTEADLGPFVDSLEGIFVGGSTSWKLETMAAWGSICRGLDLRMHVGRVNTANRIRRCGDAGATSFDGSSVARFARMNLRRLNNEVRQTWLFEVGDVQPQCRECGSPDLRHDPTDGSVDCVACGATERSGVYA